MNQPQLPESPPAFCQLYTLNWSNHVLIVFAGINCTKCYGNSQNVRLKQKRNECFITLNGKNQWLEKLTKGPALGSLSPKIIYLCSPLLRNSP